MEYQRLEKGLPPKEVIKKMLQLPKKKESVAFELGDLIVYFSRGKPRQSIFIIEQRAGALEEAMKKIEISFLT